MATGKREDPPQRALYFGQDPDTALPAGGGHQNLRGREGGGWHGVFRQIGGSPEEGLYRIARSRHRGRSGRARLLRRGARSTLAKLLGAGTCRTRAARRRSRSLPRVGARCPHQLVSAARCRANDRAGGRGGSGGSATTSPSRRRSTSSGGGVRWW